MPLLTQHDKRSHYANCVVCVYYSQLAPEQVEVDIVQVKEPVETGIEESELDEMWSFVGNKTNPRWLWHAIDTKNNLLFQV